MRDKDRERLHATAFMLGLMDANGVVVPNDTEPHHDWTKFLLAKDMYAPGDFSGPDWVPFNLWSMYDLKSGASEKIVEKLIFSPRAKDIWKAIEQNYDRPNAVAAQLPMRILEAQEEWALLGKRKPSDHRSHFLRLKANALALALEIELIEELETRDTGDRFDFMRLYDSTERAIVSQNVRLYNLRMRNMVAMEAAGRKLGYKRGDCPGIVGAKDWLQYNVPDRPSMPESPTNHSLASREAGTLFELLCGNDEDWRGIVPRVPEMLRRLASYVARESENPPLKRPVFGNAQRNHFARALCRFFRDSFGRASPLVVSGIVSLFHKQGIAENEVSQVIKKLSALKSENSPSK